MSDKILKLDQAQTLYQDLRGRIDALPTNEDIPEVPVQDVQVNGSSIINNKVANIPIATASSGNYGVTRIVSDNGVGEASGALYIVKASDSQIIVGSNNYRPIVPGNQHKAVFYGLAKAAGDSTQSSSNNAVGTYTAEAKAAIRTMLGAISSDDYAIMGGSSGVVKLVSGSGLALNGDTGALEIRNAYNAEIKTGTNNKFAITPAFQATSVFYGLAKAAGDTTQAASSNAIGTYTDEAKAAINTMLGSVSKVSLDNAGITSKTYSVKFGGQFTVTTAENSDYISPYVRASVTGRISKHYKHRVTFDGTEYILDTGLWFTSDRQKTYEYLGNLGLYVEDVSGVPQAIDNVPFVIISDLNDNSSIDVLTSVAGTHTIKVEQITPTQTKLPNSLLYGDEYAPIQKKNNGGTYNGFSIGVNELKATRGTIAFGYFNRINHEWGYAFGDNNTLDYGGITIGDRNQISDHTGYAFGYGNIISGANAIGIGNEVTANTTNMIALGSHNVPGVIINKTWASNTYYKRGEIVKAVWAPPGVSGGPELTWICKIAHTSGTYFMTDQQNGAYWDLSASNGDTLFVIGNGSNVVNSNALKIDLVGNTYLGGNLYVNCNPDSTGGTLVPTDIQVNGTSVVSNGIANIPVAGSSLGVVKVSDTYGLTMGGTNSQFIQIHGAPSNDVKNGTHTTRPIVPVRQHEAVFYGLSKVAGVNLANETVTLGTYPETSKTAIRSMIGAVGNTDYATSTIGGVVKVQSDGTYGVRLGQNNVLYILNATYEQVKSGTNWFNPIVPSTQHYAAFYGLAKAAGVDEKDSTLALGTYSDTAKAAIRSMIGATNGDVIAIQDTQPTANDVKLWLPETMPEAVDVPTMDDLEGYVKKTDYATTTTTGVVRIGAGLSIINTTGQVYIDRATNDDVKTGSTATSTAAFRPITPIRQKASVFYGLAEAAGADMASSDNAIGTYTDAAKSAIRTMIGAISNTDYATTDTAGVVKFQTEYGIYIGNNSKCAIIATATPALIQAGVDYYKPITSSNTHIASFYGLAKAAGDTTMASSSNAVGTYTPEAKTAIRTMLGVDAASIAAEVDIPLVETVTGTTPTIVGQPNVRYVCGEVSTITITPPASGSVDVIFESGSTPAVMTVPNTVKWPAWFDATTLDTGTTYEILITDGVYGSVMTWAT